MERNFGYRLGMQIRRFVRWLSVQETRLQQRGVPYWVTKIPLCLCIAAVVGLAIAGAFLIALFLALMVFIAWCLQTVTQDAETSLDERPTDGYHNTGPDGPGVYSDGEWIRRQ